MVAFLIFIAPVENDPLARQDARRGLHSLCLRTRIFMFVAAACMLFRSVGYGQSDPPAAHSGGLDFKQFGLLAIQDGGRRKPIDTFSRETLIRITGRSRYVGKAGRKWQANDFVLSGALETLDRVQQEALAVSDRLALLANVMNGSALLIVPASKSETDPWVVPPEFSRYYSETQFAPVQKELQALATAYTQGDAFQFSRA